MVYTEKSFKTNFEFNREKKTGPNSRIRIFKYTY